VKCESIVPVEISLSRNECEGIVPVEVELYQFPVPSNSIPVLILWNYLVLEYCISLNCWRYSSCGGGVISIPVVSSINVKV